jgi:hypothetical protein
MMNRVLLVLVVMVACAHAPVSAKEQKQAKLKVIAVASAFSEADQHEGKVGLEGKVVEVDAKEPSFVILTPNPPGSCQSECCAPKRFTVHVPKDKFAGKLPKKESQVVVVGNLKALTSGFDFKVLEVRQADKPIFTAKK